MILTLASYSASVAWVFATLTLLGGILTIVLFIGLILKRTTTLARYIDTNALWLMLLVAASATLGSLYFSEIAGWTPCKLCWLQRIFMYPQVILLGIAWYKRDRSIAPYILALSLIGLVIAAWHYNEQVMHALFPPVTEVPCDDSGASCASTPFFRFGYITIPMMAFTGFFLNAVGSVMVMKKRG